MYDSMTVTISLEPSATTLNFLQLVVCRWLVRLSATSLFLTLFHHLVMTQAPLFLWLLSTRPPSTFRFLGNKTTSAILPWGSASEGKVLIQSKQNLPTRSHQGRGGVLSFSLLRSKDNRKKRREKKNTKKNRKDHHCQIAVIAVLGMPSAYED